MNVLMLGRWLPPPRHPVRAMREYQFAHHLGRRHRVTLSFITDNPDTGGAIAALRNEFGDLEFAEVPRGWKSLSSAVRLVAGESCTLSYFRSEALRTRLAHRLRQTRYDLVFVSSSSMIQYALDVDPAIPMVVDFGDVDSEWWARQATRGSFPAARFFRTEAMRLRAVEAAAARRAIHCLAATPAAARVVQSLAAEATINVIESGVDVEAVSSAARAGGVPTVMCSTSSGHEVEVREAVAFCRSMLAGVKGRVPHARFVVWSKDSVATLGGDGRVRDVEVATSATELRSFFHGQTVAIAPLPAGGDLRPSVLEPMAAGVPVVTTSEVCAQLGGGPGQNMQVAGTTADFVARVVELFETPALRNKMAAEGRQFVKANFSWDVVAGRLGELLAKILPVSSENGPGPLPGALGG